MNVGDVVKIAKNHLNEAFADEAVAPPELQEVWLDEPDFVWSVVVAIFRAHRGSWPENLGPPPPTASIRVVLVADTSGKVLSVRIPKEDEDDAWS